MASYAYTALNHKGKEKKGTMEAATEQKVIYELKEQGLLPISVTEAGVFEKDIKLGGKKIKPRELSVFCRQFESILIAGVSVVSALFMLYEQTENKNMKKAVNEVRISVEKGETLADAMRGWPDIFPGILVNMVEAGEASGSLETAFGRMAVHFEKDAKLRAMVKKAMIYPIMIAIVAVGVIIVMMLFVIPNFMTMFEDMDLEMPFMTRLVIQMSNFLLSRWYLVLFAAAAAVFGFKVFASTKAGAEGLALLGLRVPLFGKLITKTAAARLASTLSTLSAAGVALIDAIDITARTMDNLIIKEALLDAKEEVAKGIPLSKPLEKSGYFPPMVYHMVRIGEETGNLESMLDKISSYYDEEVELATQSLMAALEPLVIVILALVVGVLIAAIMQPMLQMYSGMENL